MGPFPVIATVSMSDQLLWLHLLNEIDIFDGLGMMMDDGRSIESLTVTIMTLLGTIQRKCNLSTK